MRDYTVTHVCTGQVLFEQLPQGRGGGGGIENDVWHGGGLIPGWRWNISIDFNWWSETGLWQGGGGSRMRRNHIWLLYNKYNPQPQCHLVIQLVWAGFLERLCVSTYESPFLPSQRQTWQSLREANLNSWMVSSSIRSIQSSISPHQVHLTRPDPIVRAIWWNLLRTIRQKAKFTSDPLLWDFLFQL